VSSRERYTSDVCLPLQDVFNANSTWIRKDPGSGTMKLRESLRRDGMLLPILLRPDFRVIDGARRLFAAQELGWSEVPVLVTDNWVDVIAHFERVRKLEEDESSAASLLRAPMSWIEIQDLIQAHLLPRAVDGLKGRLPVGGHSEVIADIVDKRPDEVRFIREIFATARACGRISREHRLAAEAIIRNTERINGRRHTALTFLRKLSKGEVTLDEAKAFKADRYLPKGAGRPRPDRPSDDRPVGRRYAPREHPSVIAEVSVAQNLLAVLEQLGLSAKSFTELDSKLGPQEAYALAQRMRLAIPHLHAFRRLLEERATPNNPKESSK